MPVAELVVLLALACTGLLLGRLLSLPPVVCYLVTGVLAGPGLLGLIDPSAELSTLAEFGVALLLFGVGVEFSLFELGRGALRGLGTGLAQVVATVAATTWLMAGLGMAFQTALVVGFLVALSSTAVVFKLYDDQGQFRAPQGQAAAGVLLFQDLALVPMMIVLPLLAEPAGGGGGAAALSLLKAVAAVVTLLVVARALLPRVLALAARAGTPELFPPLALLIAFGTALGATRMGLSLPIGAFLAGLALSGSPYAHQVFAELLPLRDAFMAVFFTSIGLMLDPALALAVPVLVLVLVLAVVVKGAVVGVAAGLAWRSTRIGLLVGLSLTQIGEFSFVLASEAAELGLIGQDLEQAFISVAVLSMAATPWLFSLGNRLAERKDASAQRAGRGTAKHGDQRGVVIIGYGETGQAVAHVLSETSIPFVAVDMKAERVRAGEGDGIPVRFGDAGRRAVLEAAGAAEARAVLVAISDPAATKRIVGLVRQMNPAASVLARSQGVEDIAALESLGADEVVPAKLEASVELFARLLVLLGVPRHVARLQESIIRLGRYGAMRGVSSAGELLPEIERLIRGGIIETVEVMEGSQADGITLGALDLRKRCGATALILLRGEEPVTNPVLDTQLEAGDLLVLYGPHQAIAAALALLEPEPADEAGASYD